MSDQVVDYSENNIHLLENTFSLNGIKDEECLDDNFGDNKVDISETAILSDNAELQDHLLPDKIKQSDIFTTWNNIKTELSLPKEQCDTIHDTLKIEEGIKTDDTKIEFNNKFLYCEDCHVYCEGYCAQCGMLVHILNRPALVKSDNTPQEELPNDILEIQDNFGEFHVYAVKPIPINVRFGPFTGLDETDNSWKIKGGKFVVNKDKSKHVNWMHYINPARNISEQNLLAFQYEHDLYYESTRQIEEGDELLVYFGEEFEDSLNRNVEMDFVPITKHIFKDAFACTFCCLGFSSKLYLAKHKAICSGNITGDFSIEELIQCQSCKIHLDRKDYITCHMAYCSEKNNRKCMPQIPDTREAKANGRKNRQYKYRTKNKEDLEYHKDQDCQVKMYKCGICCGRYKTKEVLRLHVGNAHNCAGGKDDLEHSTEDHTKAKHVKQFKYKCDTCDYKANQKDRLNDHVETKHLKQFKYKCDTCDYKANRKGQLNAHIETIHFKEFEYQCDTCDYKSNYKYALKRHIKGIHLKEFKYHCDICDYKANGKGLLNAHIETKHLKQFKYKCDACDYKTNQKHAFKAHVEVKHLKEFKYQCDTCDYKSNDKRYLKAHIETRHLKVFKYQCDICDYKAHQKGQLKTHIEARHLKIFKYQCDTCDYKAYQKCQLKEHIETKHLKKFKYHCDTCGYKVSQKFKLRVHIETQHLKRFRYQCDTCDYKANKKSYLKAHIETKHLKEFEYQCDTCDYKSNYGHVMKSHMKAKHMKEFK